MKKIIFALFTIALLFGCKDDLEFNTPALEGIKDGELLFKSAYFVADIDNGGFLIEGGNNFETIQLITTIDAPGTYDLGGINASRAIFKDELGIVYSTANAPDESISIYPSDGQIIIEEVSNTEPKTVSGRFWFNAFTVDGLNTVNFSEGHFYRVPLIGGIEEIPNGIPCPQAINQAQSAYNNLQLITDTNSTSYFFSCTYYKSRLVQQINSCGDPDGSLQAMIDSLGDCGGFD